ncbi:hypothetical protein [Psychroserpens sp.]
MFIIKLLLIVTLVFITYQDTKERLVYWFLFPLLGLIVGVLFYTQTLPELFLASVLINLIVVCLFYLVIVLHSFFILKKSFSQVIGMGDILMFFFLIFTFSSVSFIITFIGAIFFSYMIHLLLKKNSKNETVPLAGYMSIFYSITYIAFWSGAIDSLYSI